MLDLSSNMFVARLLDGEEEGDAPEESLCGKEGNVIQLRPKEQREKFDNITDWKTLYRWAIDEIERKSEKRAYNKVIADFAEYFVINLDIEFAYPEFDDAECPEFAMFPGRMFIKTTEIHETREFSSTLVAIAAHLYMETWPPLSFKLRDRYTCFVALKTGGFFDRGLFDSAFDKDGKEYFVGTRKLKRRYGITVKIRNKEKLWYPGHSLGRHR